MELKVGQQFEVDTLVYVKDIINEEWRMRYFSHFGTKGEMYCFHNQSTSINSRATLDWEEWSLTNPLEEK